MGAILRKARIYRIEDGGVLEILHPKVYGNETTQFSQSYTSGVTQISVASSAGFSVNDFILIGKYNQEKCEINKITSLTSTTLSLNTATANNYETGTFITLIGCDQIEVSSASALGGTYSVLATISIAPQDRETVYLDANWQSSNYYKVRYKNSQTNTFGPYSGEVPGSDYQSDSLMRMARRVFNQFQDPDRKFLTLSEVFEFINDGYRIAQNALTAKNEEIALKLPSPYSLSNGAALYTLPTDFKDLKYVWVSYDGVTYYKANFTHPEDADPNDVYSTAEPRYYFQGNQIGFRPTPTSNAGLYKLCYYTTPSELSSEADRLALPYSAYPESFVNYGLYRAFEKDGKDTKAASFYTFFKEGLDTMLEQAKRTEDAESIQITDGSYLEAFDDDGWYG